MSAMDFEFSEELFHMDMGVNNADVLSPHSYANASPLQTICERSQAHFHPSSFNQPHGVQSPHSYGPLSPINMSSPVYPSPASFSTTSTGFDPASFGSRQQHPIGSLQAPSALTRQLKADAHMLPSSPVVNPSMSPMLNYDNLGRQMSVPSSSLPHFNHMNNNNNFGFPFNQDQVLSKALDNNDFGIKGAETQDLWSISPSTSFGTQAVQIPSGPHRRTSSFASSMSNGGGGSLRHGPYRRPPSLALTGTPDLIMGSPIGPVLTMPTPSSVTSELSPMNVSTGFKPDQIPAAQAIVQFINEHPSVKIPASLITRELVEVCEGKGYCLIGNCGAVREAQKMDLTYDPAVDKEWRKRLDHLQDHVKDKHFNSRPFVCTHSSCSASFAREADLKRHFEIHNNTKILCPDQTCGKSYTRPDNLGRHIKQKHPALAVAQSLPAISHMRHPSTPY